MERKATERTLPAGHNPQPVHSAYGGRPTPAERERGVAALQEEIRALARERKAVILAHNYQVPAVQDVADVVGDSLGLSLEARRTDAERIVFCGVHFMAESAKVLNPDKRVFLPHIAAGCSLADSISPESLEDWMERYPGRAVVTYVNSSAEVKAMSDICCTSANAVSVVRSLATDKILFTPDRNLGRWIAQQVPEKDIVVYDGACPTHDVLRGANVRRTRETHPEAVLIAHPSAARTSWPWRTRSAPPRPWWSAWRVIPTRAPSWSPPRAACCTSSACATRTRSSCWRTAASAAACTAPT